MTVFATVLLNRLLAKARIRHLQMLIKLGELGSVQGAADAMGITQPAATQLLGDLEQLLESPLFHRHARGVRPTALGAELLPLARRMLDTLAQGAELVVATKERGQGVVRVAASTSAISGLLVRALPAFNTAHPDIHVHLAEATDSQWGLQMARGELDLVGSRTPKVLPAGWTFTPLVPDRFAVVCGPQHPLAGQQNLGFGALAGETWLRQHATSAAQRMLDALMIRHACQPAMCQVITRVSSATWAMLQAQPLLALLPYGVVRQLVEAGQLALVGLDEPMPLEPLGFLTPAQDIAPATATLAKFLCGFAAAHP